jgi:hypothetical protein
MSRLSKFYGMDDAEFLRKHGDLIENNLQAFRDMIRLSILEWIVDRPPLWIGELPTLLANHDPDRFELTFAYGIPTKEVGQNQPDQQDEPHHEHRNKHDRQEEYR